MEKSSFLTASTIKKGITIVLGILFLVALTWAGVWGYKNRADLKSKLPFISANIDEESNKDWESYTDQKYAIKISYPSDVNVSEQPTGELFLSQGEGNNSLSLEFTAANLSNKSIQEVMKDTKNEVTKMPGLEVHSEEVITTNNRSGYKLEITGNDNFTYYFYPIGFNSYLEILDSTNGDNLTNISRDIVSSMEFLPPPSGL